MEKSSSLDRVVGNVSEEEKQKIFEKRRKMFETTNIEKIHDLEKEKTPKEQQILLEVNAATNELRKKYGLPDFNIPEGNMHLIRKEEWATQGDVGVSLPEMERVLFRERERGIHLALTAHHEEVHFKTFNAVQRLTDCDEIEKYRGGLRITPRSRAKINSLPNGDPLSYFADLNEAVTEELSRQYIMNQVGNPLFKEDFDETKRLREELLKRGIYKPLLNPDIYSLYQNTGDDTIYSESFGYPAERLALYQIRNQIFQENRDTFKNTEEVLDVFARAMFTGHMMELSHLMEKTFGKGTMRAMGTP
jgi:hypothetical protein